MVNVELNKQAKLSEHYTLGELTKTSVKSLDGNIPSHEAIENLKRLCPKEGNRRKTAFLQA